MKTKRLRKLAKTGRVPHDGNWVKAIRCVDQLSELGWELEWRGDGKEPDHGAGVIDVVALFLQEAAFEATQR